MVIEPYILIPSAAAAVLVMVLYIRFMTGARNMQLTETNIRLFLSQEEVGVPVQTILISDDGRAALISLSDPHPLRLIRSFGDKMVMQVISEADIQTPVQGKIGLVVKRQDIGHGPLTFRSHEDLSKLIKEAAHVPA